MKIKHQNIILIVLAVGVLGFGAFLFSLEQPYKVESKTATDKDLAPTPIIIATGPKSPMTGEVCANAKRRPLGIMLSGDAVTRPLSGIGAADLVVEMPVITNGITRFLALFNCQEPVEMGSIRSARDDFIPLAQGFDAIYGHWGGSHFALDDLKKGTIDNINALTNPHGAYFRKSDIVEPHNGFTTYAKFFSAAQKLGYREETNFQAYAHGPSLTSTTNNPARLTIPYPGQFTVGWEYDPTQNNYRRQRGAKDEIDKNTGTIVTAKVVIVLRTSIKQIEGQYNDVAVLGKGQGVLYQDGLFQEIAWRKDRAESRLMFLETADKEASLAPGRIWIEYVSNDAAVSYESLEVP